MKFLATHRKDLMKFMQAQGISPDRFDYIKRRGRIHLVDPESGKTFLYFRRKETQIHPETKQWVELESYEVKADNGRVLQLEDWPAVLGKFQEWLNSF